MTQRLQARADERVTVVESGAGLYLRLDPEGRWTAFGERGGLFRRTLDGHVVRPSGDGFVELDPAQAAAVDAHVVRRAGEVLEALDEVGEGLVLRGRRELLVERLARAACGEACGTETSRRRFDAAYPERVPILPPHRYRDVVVMPATGCPNHRCSFCAFYRDQPFRLLSEAAFRAHVSAVRELFGAALGERDGIFLGSASALSLADDVLERRLAVVEELLGRPRRGVAAFLEADRAPRRSAASWSRHAAAGLVEATLGLETGEPALRAEVGKAGDLGAVRAAVEGLVEAGVAVSLTVLLGLGGEAAASAHREATVAFVATLPLGSGDRLYLSPLAGALPPARLAAERAAFRSALADAGPARVGDYRIERFAWLA